MSKCITLIQGSSTDDSISKEVHDFAKNKKSILVILDSNHTHDHVLKEIQIYSPLVTKNSYLVVFDTLVEDMPDRFCIDRPWGKGNNPKTAVWEFMKTNDRFEIDKNIEAKLLITVAPDGYLKCIKELIMQFIPVSGPSITQKEIDYVTDAITNAWYSNANIYNDRFEKAFTEYLGVKYAIALPSCTSAIHLSLLALGVKAGDEVIVPDVTWIASAAPIDYVGATPVFADIDPKTWCLSASSLESYITPKTKAIIPVDLYGGMPDMTAILEIANRYQIPIIEDAAEAIGSEFNGRKAGSFGDTGVFSFHGSKTLTTGEGGMLVTNREDIYQRVLFLRDHGRKPGDKLFFNTEVGYKYKMSSMQAALGLAQLERIEELVDRKRQIFSWYQSELDSISGLTINYEPDNVKNTYWMVTAIFDS